MRIIVNEDKSYTLIDELNNTKDTMNDVMALHAVWQFMGANPNELNKGLKELREKKDNCIHMGDINYSFQFTERV